MPTMSKLDRNNAAIKAVGHPIRREILRRLAGNPNGCMSPKLLANALDAPLGDVSYHVRTLVQLGVLKLAETKPRRGAIEHCYVRASTIVDAKVQEMLDLIGKD